MTSQVHAKWTPVRLSGLSRLNDQVLQAKCACGGSAGIGGTCTECQQRKLLGKPLQTKLQINEPGDQYEVEADRVAERVMRMPESHSFAPRPESFHGGDEAVVHTPVVQRAEANGDTPAAEDEKPKEEGSRCPSWRGDPQSISKRAGVLCAQPPDAAVTSDGGAGRVRTRRLQTATMAVTSISVMDLSCA